MSRYITYVYIYTYIYMRIKAGIYVYMYIHIHVYIYIYQYSASWSLMGCLEASAPAPLQADRQGLGRLKKRKCREPQAEGKGGVVPEGPIRLHYHHTVDNRWYLV